MKSFPLHSFENVESLLQHYSFQDSDFKHGTRTGFAASLLLDGGELAGAQEVAYRMSKYQEEASSHAGQRDYDAYLIGQATEMALGLAEHQQERTALADYISSMKREAHGVAAWAKVAQLATTNRHARPAILAASVPAELVKRMLEGLAPLASQMRDWSNMLEYHPGVNGLLDKLIRRDILCFDATLREAPPWSGDIEDEWFEMKALATLL